MPLPSLGQHSRHRKRDDVILVLILKDEIIIAKKEIEIKNNNIQNERNK